MAAYDPFCIAPALVTTLTPFINFQSYLCGNQEPLMIVWGKKKFNNHLNYFNL